MSEKSRSNQDLHEQSEFLKSLSRLMSDRAVRPVVTRTGARARGFVASLKAHGPACFESTVERDALRLLEVCSLVKAFKTRPFVLGLEGPQKFLRYTPDVVIEFEEGGAVVEVKGSYFLGLPKQRERLVEIGRRLSREGFAFTVVPEKDLRDDGLQEELCELLRMRPLRMRRLSGFDVTAWDPLNCAETDIDLERRWLVAPRECDALLERAMRRDPDELFSLAR